MQSPSGRPPRPSWLYSLIAVLSWPFVRAIFRLRASGVENLPSEGGLVLAANHWSNFDPWPLGIPLVPRRFLRFMAKSELFWFPLGWIARDSTVLLTIAAGLIGAVIVVAVTRLAGSKPIGQRRILFASVAYSVGFAATYTGVGVAIKNLVRII